jgi:ectoine hydroxylase-related dioxygenase (phytanoyl-CoA dioxygenase family)
MNRDLLHDITEEQIRQYEADGAICIRGQFDQEWIDRMLAAAIDNIDNPSGRRGIVDNEDDPGRMITGTHMSRFNDEFMEIAIRSPAAQIAAKLMRLDEVRYFYDQLLIKEAGSTVPVRWHNDLSYWPLDGNHVVTVWVACTPVSVATSGLVYLAGSHKGGKVYKPPRTNYKSVAETSVSAQSAAADETERLDECPDLDSELDNPDYRFISWDMEAGDALVHHPLTLHASGKNASKSQQRVAFALRYFGGDATWRGHRTRFVVPGTEDDAVFERGKMPIDDKLFPVVWRKGL